jgi:hypothetical protein
MTKKTALMAVFVSPAGLEPAPQKDAVLSRMRLPIPPRGQKWGVAVASFATCSLRKGGARIPFPPRGQRAGASLLRRQVMQRLMANHQPYF